MSNLKGRVSNLTLIIKLIIKFSNYLTKWLDHWYQLAIKTLHQLTYHLQGIKNDDFFLLK